MGNKNKLPDILTKEELIKLFEAMIRPKCVIACFTALVCGLRVREVCNLQISDINLERRIIKIRDSKNPNRKKQGNYGKDRIVPIPQVAIPPIKKWIDIVDGGKWFLPSAKSSAMYRRMKSRPSTSLFGSIIAPFLILLLASLAEDSSPKRCRCHTEIVTALQRDPFIIKS